jgi:uncharacterized caspase-like protein
LNDARGVRDILRDKFNFPPENILLLTDGEATRDKIMSSYLSFRDDDSSQDDRILFFFAGHGFTGVNAILS